MKQFGYSDTPAPRLQLNTFDFSDLWDDEDLDPDIADDYSFQSNVPPKPGHNLSPPAPPPAPPLAPFPIPLVNPAALGLPRQTLRLHWREVSSLQPLSRVSRFGSQSIWALLEPVHLDTNRLEYLFRSKSSSNKALSALKGSARKNKQRVSVLGTKRSNIITIALSSLPPPHLLPPAVYSMDSSVLDMEDVQLAVEQLATNKTFRCILATVLAIGNCLNGCKARGFELSYLGNLSQVRDTHSRQPLLHHVCVLMLQLYPQCSDLYSDINAVTRASKFDYSQVQFSLSALESRCKASWEQLHVLNTEGTKAGARRGEGDEQRGVSEACLYHRLPQVLRECSERLKVLRAVHRRVVNRFHSFLLYLGYSRSMVRETGADTFCKTVSDFALEYRAARHAILQRRERGQDERGKEEGELHNAPSSTDEAEAEESPALGFTEHSLLEEVLNTPTSPSCFVLSLPRQRSRTLNRRGCLPRKLKW